MGESNRAASLCPQFLIEWSIREKLADYWQLAYLYLLFLSLVGIEILTAECRRQDDGSPARESMCDPALRPPVQNYPCKEEACPPVYVLLSSVLGMI